MRRLRRAKEISDAIPSAYELGPRIDEIKEEAQQTRKLLKTVAEDGRKSDDRDERIIVLEGTSNAIDLSISDLSLLLSQRVMSSLVRKREQRLVRTKMCRFFVMPRQTKIVANKYLNECLDSIYGRVFRDKYSNLTPIITIWPHPAYRYSWFSRTISIPPQDSTKMCRFSSLAHEVCHSKIHNIMRALKAEKSPNEELAMALLGKDWESVNKKWGELEKRFVDLLTKELGKTYSRLFSNLQDKFIVPKKYLAVQFAEILCDVATTKTCGPADIFMLGWTSAPFCRNPVLGVHRHLLDLNHPPDIVRLRYELYLLQIGQNNLSGRQKFPAIFKTVDNLIGFDLRKVPRKKWTDLQNLSDHLVGTYTSIVLRLLEKEIAKLVDSILGNAEQFNQKRWKSIVHDFKEFEKNGELNRENIQPYDLTNIAWLKVNDIYEKTIKKGLTYRDFKRLRNKQRKFFKYLWDYAVKKQFVKMTP